jgi:hypothetical protein
VTRSTDAGLSQPYFKTAGTKAGNFNVSLTPEGRREAAEHLSFNHEKLEETLRRALKLNQILSEGPEPRLPTIEIQITSVRARSSFSAVMFGFMAGDDHINGNIIVRQPKGPVLQRFAVSASYALGGLAGGQESTRMGWLYETFAKHVVQELTGKTEEQSVSDDATSSPNPSPRLKEPSEKVLDKKDRDPPDRASVASLRQMKNFQDGRYRAVTFDGNGAKWSLELNLERRTIWGSFYAENCGSCPGTSGSRDYRCGRQSIKSLAHFALSCGGGGPSRINFQQIIGSLSQAQLSLVGYGDIDFSLLNESEFDAYQRFAARNPKAGTDVFARR